MKTSRLAIITFHDKQTLVIWENEGYDKKAEKQLPTNKWDKAQRIMQALNEATSLNDVEQYEPGTKSGQYEGKTSLKISDQYRVLFRWEDGDAYDVFAGDPEYHD